ncbi:MAG: RNA polymerase sigma factor, partial [Sandaracinaceae bacterium]
MGGHAGEMGAAAAWGAGLDEPKSVERAPSVRLEEIYDACFDFVWRSARRMGVAEAHADDVVQEVFLVAHRRLADFEGRSSVRTWLFGILLRVVSDHRRTLRRKGGLSPLP